MIKTTLVVLLLLIAGKPCGAQTPPHIEWQVQNQFRLFKTETGTASDASTLAKTRAILTSIASAPSISAAYTSVEKQIRSDQSYSIEPIYLYTAFDRTRGTYEHDYVVPKSERIIAVLANPAPGDITCTWTVDGGPPRTQPCARPFVFTAAFDPTTFHAHAVVNVQTASAAAPNPPYTITIDAPDRLVVGFGDSYASGEGNPDRPADLSQVKTGGIYAHAWDWWHPDVAGIPRLVLPREASADWWSNECHRSLFSPQALAAMKLATMDSHQSVTFISYACAGAAVLDGFIVRQNSPPGEDRLKAIHTELKETYPGLASTTSQLTQAAGALCAYQTQEQPLTSYNPGGYPTWDFIYSQLAKNNPRPPTYPSCNKFVRTPDIIFITLGGNDIGFAGLGAWALMPPNTPVPATATRAIENLSWNQLGLVCPAVPYQADVRCVYHGGPTGNPGAMQLTDYQLPRLLELASSALKQSGLLDHAVVIQEAYPAPFTDASGMACGRLKAGTDFVVEADLKAPWRALNVLLLNLIEPEVGADRAQELATDVLPSLNNRLFDSGKTNHWTVAESPANYAGHGYCAGASGNARDFGLPALAPILIGYGAVWDPRYASPAQWDPYDPNRLRWLRVANDSLLTEMVSDDNGDIMTESLGGMLHPTAAGEAAVADELFRVIPASLTMAALPPPVAPVPLIPPGPTAAPPPTPAAPPEGLVPQALHDLDK